MSYYTIPLLLLKPSQCKLFHSIKPLFGGKPTLLVLNKIDVMRLEELPPSSRAIVDEIIADPDIQHVQISCSTTEGVMELKNKACDALLAHRVETKLKGNKINSIINRIHVAVPKARDDVERPAFIPDAVKDRKKYDKNDSERRRLLKDVELEEGGPGVFNINLKSELLLFSSQLGANHVQRTIFSQIQTGRKTSSRRLWTGRISQISSTPTSPKSSRHSSEKRNGYKQRASTTTTKISFVYQILPILPFYHLFFFRPAVRLGRRTRGERSRRRPHAQNPLAKHQKIQKEPVAPSANGGPADHLGAQQLTNQGRARSEPDRAARRGAGEGSQCAETAGSRRDGCRHG